MNPDFRLTAHDIKQTQENALEMFYSGIRSKETRRTMDGNLRYFLENVCAHILSGDYKQRAQQFVDITREDQKKASAIVMAYVRHLAQRTALEKSHPNYIKPSYIPNKVKPIQKLLTMNDLGLPWKKIRTLYPNIENTQRTRGYTRDEIKKLLEYSDCIETDFIILAASSGGFRNGAWDNQKWSNICPIFEVNGEYKIELEKNQTAKIDCATVIIYKGTSWEYNALISIEAWNKLQEYKKVWTKKMKRSPTDSDPLILARGKKQIPLTDSAIRTRILKLLIKAGLRSPLTEGKRHHEVPATHGFRKYWNKVMMQTKRKKGTLSALVTKEYLLGHKGLVKTDKNYFWIDILEQVPEYLEAMPELMISDEERLKQKLEAEKLHSKQLKRENAQLDDALQKISELEFKINRMEKYQTKD